MYRKRKKQTILNQVIYINNKLFKIYLLNRNIRDLGQGMVGEVRAFGWMTTCPKNEQGSRQ
jgi:hypothetical protein